MKVRYAAPAATIALAVIAAVLFILLVNDEDEGPAPAATPTPDAQSNTPAPSDVTPTVRPTFTPLPATATPTAVPTAQPTSTPEPSPTTAPTPIPPIQRFSVPGQVFRLDGDTIWGTNAGIGISQYDLVGERIQSPDLLSSSAVGNFHDFEVIGDTIWIVNGGPREKGIVRVKKDGSSVDLLQFGASLEIQWIETDGQQVWVDARDQIVRHTLDGTMLEPIQFENQIQMLHFAGGYFWVTLLNGDIIQMDPDGNEVTRIDTDITVTALAFDGESLWISMNDSIVRKWDLEGNELASFDGSRGIRATRQIAIHDEGVWVVFADPSVAEGHAVRLNESAELQQEYLDGLAIGGVVFGHDSAWFFANSPFAVAGPGFTRLRLDR